MKTNLFIPFTWQRYSKLQVFILGLDWGLSRFSKFNGRQLWRYTLLVFVPHFRATSVFGFGLLIGILVQMWSGFLLAVFYGMDPSFAMNYRLDYMWEVWWFPYVYRAHVLGVDLIFTLSYLHILKKIYIRNYAAGDLDGWFTGAYAFLIFHVVVFLGITLSTNHLGDVTLTIGANMFWSLLGSWHRSYTILFGNKHLSTDQLIRFAVAHYIAAWYYTYLIQTHVLFIHEAWDADANRSSRQESLSPKASWGWDGIKKEVLTMFTLYKVLGLIFLLLAHPDTRVVNYSFFEQWSETEMEEINFFIVAPHWYFRPHMGLLTVCAQHYEGLFWLVSFYVLLCFLPQLYRLWTDTAPAAPFVVRSAPLVFRFSVILELLYVMFFASLLFVGGSLPCGRFYYESIDGFFGHSLLRLSYEYLYLYLAILLHWAENVERWFLTFAVRNGYLNNVSTLSVTREIFPPRKAVTPADARGFAELKLLASGLRIRLTKLLRK